MKYVESLLGNHALEIPSNEYALAGHALNAELAFQPWDGSPLHDKADEPFIELTLEHLAAQHNIEPSDRDIIAGARMLPTLLQEAHLLVKSSEANGIMSEVERFDAGDENWRLFAEMEAAAASTEDARQYGIGARASDLARRESLIMTPPVAQMTVNGLKRFATWHGPIGNLRYRYQQSRADSGLLPPAASQLYARPKREIREQAITVLNTLSL